MNAPSSEGPRRAESGLTLVELSLVMVVAVPLIMAVLGTTKLVNSTIDADAHSAEVHSVVRQTAQRIGQMVRPGKLATFRVVSTMDDVNATPQRAAAPGQWIEPPDPFPSPHFRAGIRFQAASGLLSMNARLNTSPRELLFELDPGELANGVDDDGDGIVDEGALRLLYDGTQVVLVQGITRFEAAIDGRFLRVRLRCERVDDAGRTFGATLEQSYYVRNN